MQTPVEINPTFYTKEKSQVTLKFAGNGEKHINFLQNVQKNY